MIIIPISVSNPYLKFHIHNIPSINLQLTYCYISFFFLACHVADLAGEDTPQVYLACGRGPRSSLRALRHGLEVAEMAVSELPGSPNAVWTVRRHKDGKCFAIFRSRIFVHNFIFNYFCPIFLKLYFGGQNDHHFE